jgi:ArsR family transcriptional regulator
MRGGGQAHGPGADHRDGQFVVVAVIGTCTTARGDTASSGTTAARALTDPSSGVRRAAARLLRRRLAAGRLRRRGATGRGLRHATASKTSRKFDGRDGSASNGGQQVFSISCRTVTSLSLVQCCAPLGEPALSESDAKELERVFKALADRHRVRILNRLLSAGGEAVCVCEFEEMLGLKQSTVSYHLKQLLDAGIVEREKRGSYAYFSLAAGSLQRVCALLGYAVQPVAAVA